MQIITFLPVFLLQFALPSFATEENYACRASEECTLGEEQCYRPLAINKRYKKINEESNKENRPLIQCEEYKGPSKEKYRAVCKEKKCVLELK
jgi:hypothetical protein